MYAQEKDQKKIWEYLKFKPQADPWDRPLTTIKNNDDENNNEQTKTKTNNKAWQTLGKGENLIFRIILLLDSNV